MKTIRESNGLAIIEIGDAFYVVAIDHDKGQVYSVLASDMPVGPWHSGATWYGGLSDGGVKYVASGRSRKAAFAAFRRLNLQTQT